MDPFTTVKSTIAIVQAISSTYKAIQQLRGLPEEFDEANRILPLVQDTLGLVHDQLKSQVLDEASKEALRPVVSDCEEKAKMLLNIFERVEKGVKNAKGGSVLDFYRATMIRLGKAHRVETLMQGILRGLEALATNQLFRTATRSQMDELKQTIAQLSNAEFTIRDSGSQSPTTNSQNIAPGGTGRQSNITGQYNNIHSGSGQQNIISGNRHTINFSTGQEDL